MQEILSFVISETNYTRLFNLFQKHFYNNKEKKQQKKSR